MKRLRRQIQVYEDKLLCQLCNRVLPPPTGKKGIFYYYDCPHCKVINLNKRRYPDQFKAEIEPGSIIE